MLLNLLKFIFITCPLTNLSNLRGRKLYTEPNSGNDINYICLHRPNTDSNISIKTPKTMTFQEATEWAEQHYPTWKFLSCCKMKPHDQYQE